MSAQFTPGPWKATALYGEDTSEPFIVWCDSIGAAIAHVYNRSEKASNNLNTQRANARLLAAAPELLDALKGMREWARRVKVANPGDEIFKAILAIEKAEGGQQ